jgi:hypothetical protein
MSDLSVLYNDLEDGVMQGLTQEMTDSTELEVQKRVREILFHNADILVRTGVLRPEQVQLRPDTYKSQPICRTSDLGSHNPNI